MFPCNACLSLTCLCCEDGLCSGFTKALVSVTVTLTRLQSLKASASLSASLYSLDLNLRFIKCELNAKMHKVVGSGISCVRAGRCFSEQSESQLHIQKLLCWCNSSLFNPFLCPFQVQSAVGQSNPSVKQEPKSPDEVGCVVQK